MDEFRWIQMFSCLMLMIQITVSVTDTSILMKAGDDVTLPCLNVTDDQNNCDRTTWVFTSRNKQTVELIELGQIGEKDKTKSDRLSVPANCSLVIKKVTVEDVGHYYCQQYKVGETRDKDTLVHQSLVRLSVINMTERKDADKVTVGCSVLTYEQCHHTVKWLIKGQDVNKDNKQTEIPQTDCSTTVSLPQSHHFNSSRDNTVKCEVTDTETGKVQLFTFNHQPSGDTKPTQKPTTKTESSTESVKTTTANKDVSANSKGVKKTTQKPTTKTESSTESVKTTTAKKDVSANSKGILWYIIAAVGSVIILITFVLFIRWKRTEGNKTQMDGNTGLSLNPAETQSAPQTSQDLDDPEVSYAYISYTKKSNSKAQVQTDDEGDAAAYSTVEAPSSSAAATADPRNLYSTVNFPTA